MSREVRSIVFCFKILILFFVPLVKRSAGLSYIFFVTIRALKLAFSTLNIVVLLLFTVLIPLWSGP